MTQILKKQYNNVSDISEYYNEFYKSQNDFKQIILNYIFRNIVFVTKQSKIKVLTISDYENITENTNIPIPLAHKFVSRFLMDLIRVKRFIQKNPQILHSKKQNQKVSIYLHKFYRIAPIFDYKRARENSRILKLKLNKLLFCLQIMTQIAIIIFITDLIDKNHSQKIIQTNIRALCGCSAYTFHRIRNKVGLTSKFIKERFISK